MSQKTNAAPVLVWFRNDLRIADNPALYEARKSGAPVLPVYIYDENAPHAPGAASRWWLHHSLKSLSAALRDAGTRLILRRGDGPEMMATLTRETNARAVYWNRRYYAPHIGMDNALEARLKKDGVDVHSFNGNLLREPWELQTQTGDHYKVYSPFWRALQKAGPSRNGVAPAMQKIYGPERYPDLDEISDWNLPPAKPDWAKSFADEWTPGEKGARERLDVFLREAVNHYADGRDRPDCDYTSRLSPHLAFGEISPLTIWQETRARIDAGDISSTAGEKFLSEIAWREFSYSLLFHHDDLPEKPLREEFSAFSWRDDKEGFKAWRKGMTGYPIIDAGMRQLWRTGWMHNRVRMIVASFLVKDLLVPWREGAAWFWDTLLDADLANNAASWQWVSGCGADAAPYFRVFNPVTQGQKFDPDGRYVREFVTELAEMPSKYIHAPWKAPADALQKAGIRLGKTYPEPILDHGEARRRALERYNWMKAG